MRDMFKKINAREKLIGWYHSGPKLRASDLEINELFKRWTPNPLLVIIDVQPKEVGVPTDAYFAVDEIKDVSVARCASCCPFVYLFIFFSCSPLCSWRLFLDQDGTTTTRTFVHTPSIIEAEEAEEIGVEHLLRDIRDVAVGTLSTRITSQLQSLQGLHLRLRDIGHYLQKVLDHELPVNHAILGNLQDVFNLLPNMAAPSTTPRANGTEAQPHNSDLARAMSIKTNDQLMAIYLSSLIRAITAFHDLIDNKIQNRLQQESESKKEKEAAANSAKSEKDATKKSSSTTNSEPMEEPEDKDKPKKKG